ncbi:MAG TPA: hypothetical protein VGO16_14520, partial [Pseudonocardiaceae bacterium]|nr:hypothetical protein [Pseudonocardiaceae bacterium]
MIREDRLLLADLGRLNSDVVPLAMRIMDDSATAEVFAERLAAMAQRLQVRAAHVGLVINGEVAIAADQNVNGTWSSRENFWMVDQVKEVTRARTRCQPVHGRVPRTSS